LASPSDTGGDIESNRTGRREPNLLTMGAERSTAGSQKSGPLPRVGLFGEFSAGKSSIANLLLGRDMLPTAVLSSTRWPTYVRHAPDLRIEAISEKGEHEPLSPDAVKTLARDDISHFDVGMPHELLRYLEVLDTPGFADPFHHSKRTLDVVGSADICIWCTLATQAWRQSERQIWMSLPARLRANSILVVTHTDTLAHPRERPRVRNRLKRETGSVFSDIVLIAIPEAMRAIRADGRIADPDLWRDSGGGALIAALQRAVTNHRKSRRKGGGFEEATEAPRSGMGFAQTESTVSTAATLSSVLDAAAMPAPPGTSGVPPQPVAAVELQSFLAKVMETVPACLAAAWIDLAKRQVLLLRGLEAGEIAGSAVLGEAITELFQGSNVQRIEGLFKRSRGLANDERHYFQEIVIVADGCVGIFLRDQSRTDRSLVVVSDGTVNLGMILARARGVLESSSLLT
jgi:Dynamin family